MPEAVFLPIISPTSLKKKVTFSGLPINSNLQSAPIQNFEVIVPEKQH
jgi:hypothetical protein